MRSFHEWWALVSVVTAGLVGLGGVTLAALRRQPPRWGRYAVAGAVMLLLVQVASGVAVLSQGFEHSDSLHTFYGILVLLSFAFAYVYRAQFAKRPALAYGLLMLWVVGLATRVWWHQ